MSEIKAAALAIRVQADVVNLRLTLQAEERRAALIAQAVEPVRETAQTAARERRLLDVVV